MSFLGRLVIAGPLASQAMLCPTYLLSFAIRSVVTVYPFHPFLFFVCTLLYYSSHYLSDLLLYGYVALWLPGYIPHLCIEHSAMFSNCDI
ncbi:hypothetical protein BKA70DRAFT_1279500 [Coprinopsis sp. MPI-PUGE-AT-0042]|nr:hypothetical protein BKA70DRAFT_1279500 [Coprinopsis sp. MPI-PUGE-AT-0042]